MTIGDKIKHYREALQMTQEELAAKANTSPQNIYKYEKGIITNIPLTRIELLAGIFGISPNALTGWDEEQSVLSIPGIMPLPANKAYPLLGNIACGTPILAEENISEWVQFPGEIAADFCLRCRGDSMVDARIHDGDIVFIRQQPEVNNGQIAAVLIGEEATLKRVYRSAGALTLVPANSQYPPMVYTGDQLSQVRIIGRAVAFLSGVK